MGAIDPFQPLALHESRPSPHESRLYRRVVHSTRGYRISTRAARPKASGGRPRAPHAFSHLVRHDRHDAHAGAAIDQANARARPWPAPVNGPPRRFGSVRRAMEEARSFNATRTGWVPASRRLSGGHPTSSCPCVLCVPVAERWLRDHAPRREEKKLHPNAPRLGHLPLQRYFLYGRSNRSASRCASAIACAGVLLPLSAACRPSLSALVTRSLSCVDSSGTAY